MAAVNRTVARTLSMLSNNGSLSSCKSRLYVIGNPFSSVSSDTRLPTSRPLLPRASSATSGFFFCGMSDEPVVYASAMRMKSNSLLDHRITSSASRDRCTPSSDATKQNSTAKSRSLTASIEFCETTGLPRESSKPSIAATWLRSSGSVEPASAPLPSGQTFTREKASSSRSRSRSIISTYASKWCAK